MTNVKSLF